MKTQDNQTPPNISKWMPLWIGDLRRETNGKPLEFIALYVNLMMAAWENGGQLQDDEEYLFRASGAVSAKQWMTHRQALANLFVPRHGAWTHNLIRAELMKAAAVAQRRREASKKGNASRWGIARINAKEATDALMAQITKDGGAY